MMLEYVKHLITSMGLPQLYLLLDFLKSYTKRREIERIDYINCIRDKRKAEQTAYQFRGLKDIR